MDTYKELTTANTGLSEESLRMCKEAHTFNIMNCQKTIYVPKKNPEEDCMENSGTNAPPNTPVGTPKNDTKE